MTLTAMTAERAKTMRFDIMTLFPEVVDMMLGSSIIGRARQGGLIEVRTHNIRDYSKDKHHRVDDTPYGGGKGMLMAAPPICDCYDAIVAEQGDVDIKRRVIYMSPRGKVLTQKRAFELTEYDNIVILCGHYEGVDERAIRGDCRRGDDQCGDYDADRRGASGVRSGRLRVKDDRRRSR